MKLNEGAQFLAALSDKSVKSKFFSIDSLTNLAYLKRKVNSAVSDHNDLILLWSVKLKVVDKMYAPISDSEEHKKDYTDFITTNGKLLNEDIPDLTLNFVPKEELVKVLEDCSLDIKIVLITHLLKQQ